MDVCQPGLSRTNSAQEYREKGFTIVDDLIPKELLRPIHDEIKTIGRCLAPDMPLTGETSIHDVWMYLARKDRALAAALYDAMKHSIAIKRLATEPLLVNKVKELLGFSSACVIDLMIRIDAPDEAKFLFGWHQDYWFSICSPQAMVAWMPIIDLTEETGGIQVIPNTVTGGRLFKVKRNPVYHSYSNAVLIDEPVDESEAVKLAPATGSVAFFQFNVLHRSLPNLSSDKCRWTLQLRFSSFEDVEFQKERYRIGVVNAEKITYLERVEACEAK